ncbi:MAG: hypothetical protein IPM77_03410 [Crocinitomicaceae bacterium]|nr:hypothetical protein [Crocinitomicaceae bacterium]
MSRIVAIAVLFSAFVSCTSDEQSSELKTDSSKDPLEAFNDFPDSLFHGIYFGQTTEETTRWLDNHHFRLLDSSGLWRYINDVDSTEFLVPLTPELRSFKIILNGYDYLNGVNGLKALFQAESVSADFSSEFDIYEFVTGKNEFKLSVFKQPEYIRLNFELKISK